MTVTIAKYNKDSYIIVEEGGKTVTYKAKLLMKTSETTYTGTQDVSYESEFFEATFLKEEASEMTNYERERILGALHYKDENGSERSVNDKRRSN